jgi:hypothetical protein
MSRKPIVTAILHVPSTGLCFLNLIISSFTSVMLRKVCVSVTSTRSWGTGFPCRHFEITEQAVPSNADDYYDNSFKYKRLWLIYNNVFAVVWAFYFDMSSFCSSLYINSGVTRPVLFQHNLRVNTAVSSDILSCSYCSDVSFDFTRYFAHRPPKNRSNYLMTPCRRAWG